MSSLVSQEELDAIEARLRAASGDRWLLAHDDDGVAVVRVEHDEGTSSELPVMRDLDPASEADVAFVAHSRGDAERLTAAVRDGADLPTEDRRVIRARCDAASPGPWRAFLEEDGGLGGSSVIWVTDGDEVPDLYLWLDGRPASGADFEFVAEAREDIPGLLAALDPDNP